MQPSVHTKCQSREPLPLRVWTQGPSQAPLPFHLQHKDNKLEIIECQLTETHRSRSISLIIQRHSPRVSDLPKVTKPVMAESGCEPSDRKTNHVLMPPEASSPTSRPLLKSQVELRTIKRRSDKGHLTQAPYQLLSEGALSGRPDAPVWEGRELEPRPDIPLLWASGVLGLSSHCPAAAA